MRTTINLPDELTKEVLRFTHTKNLAGAVLQAVRDYVQKQRLQAVRNLRGKIEFAEGFDPRAIRNLDLKRMERADARRSR